jgi:hypothetical protein
MIEYIKAEKNDIFAAKRRIQKKNEENSCQQNFQSTSKPKNQKLKM